MMRMIKMLAFQMMLSFRGIILGVSRLFALMFLGSFSIAIYYSEPNQIPLNAKIMLLTLGAIFTLIYWFYDYLIFILKPSNIDLRFYK